MNIHKLKVAHTNFSNKTKRAFLYAIELLYFVNDFGRNVAITGTGKFVKLVRNDY